MSKYRINDFVTIIETKFIKPVLAKTEGLITIDFDEYLTHGITAPSLRHEIPCGIIIAYVKAADFTGQYEIYTGWHTVMMFGSKKYIIPYVKIDELMRPYYIG